jgi:hypothetical protein
MGVIQLRTAHLSYLLFAFLMWGALGCKIQDDTFERSRPYFLYFQSDQPVSRTGPMHHPIATTSAKAQGLFDQGMAFVYGFNFEEAMRAFENASKFDPQAAMAYWGIALANSPSYNSGIYNSPTREKAAYEAIQKAKQLAAKGPQNECKYIDALAIRLTDSPNPSWEKLALDYSAAMRVLSNSYPDDPDAATLYAESVMDLHPYHLWTYDGQPGENTLEIVSVLEGVLRRWPDHVGANHFYIHAMEASPLPARALASAHRLETLMPSAGHLLHMPAHIYYRTGDYAAAVKSCLAAAKADMAYLKTKTILNKAYERAYAEHNLHFLVASANMDGDFQVAYQAATELRQKAQEEIADRPDAEALLVAPLSVLLRFARWDDILALPSPNEKFRGLTLFWHFARGCALAERSKVQEAQTEHDAMEQIYKSIPANQHFGMFGSWTAFHANTDVTLRTRIAEARGDTSMAIAQWRSAVAEQDRVERDNFYRELPAWYYTARESLGAALLQSGQPAQAEKVFREDLSINLRNPRSLFGLREALVAQGRTDEAKQVELQFEAAWQGLGIQLRIKDF